MQTFFKRIVGFKYFWWILLVCCIVTFMCNAYFASKDKFIPSKVIKLAGTSADFNHFYNISFPPKEFLVWNENCRIPRPEVFSKYIKQIYVPYGTHVCSNDKPLVWKIYDSNLEQYRLRIDEKRYKAGLYNCSYKAVVQNKIPNLYDTTRREEFHDNFLVPKSLQFGIIVQCVSRSLANPTYDDVFFFFQPKPNAVNDKKENSTNDGKYQLGIILIGMDSLSQFNIRRTMPRTFDFLMQNGWFELSGYNKVGWNTLPNLMALLSGYNITASNKHCSAYYRGYLDECHLIFEKFQKNGFVTAYAEDQTCMSTFLCDAVGFWDTPTDFYLLPLLKFFEKQLRFQRNEVFCIAERLTANIIYDAATDFMLDVNQSKFGLFWSNSFSHDDYARPSSYDEHMLDYMEKWQRLGFFEKNIFIFLSDHGMRWGELTKTPEGYYEKRLPTMFMWLPPSIRKKYPEFVYALTVNKNRLTSPFDIYVTLQHLLSISKTLNGDEPGPIQEAESCTSCQSVLRPVKENRSCPEAGIPLHYCACQPYIRVPTKKLTKLGLMNLVVSRINDYLSNRASGMCQELMFDKVIYGSVKPKNFRAEKDAFQALDLKQIDPNNEGMVFRVMFTAKPRELKNGRQFSKSGRPQKVTELIYEATFIYFRKSHQINLNLYNDISLEMEYGDMSWCVDEILMKRFCICH